MGKLRKTKYKRYWNYSCTFLHTEIPIQTSLLSALFALNLSNAKSKYFICFTWFVTHYCINKGCINIWNIFNFRIPFTQVKFCIYSKLVSVNSKEILSSYKIENKQNVVLSEYILSNKVNLHPTKIRLIKVTMFSFSWWFL